VGGLAFWGGRGRCDGAHLLLNWAADRPYLGVENWRIERDKGDMDRKRVHIELRRSTVVGEDGGAPIQSRVSSLLAVLQF